MGVLFSSNTFLALAATGAFFSVVLALHFSDAGVVLLAATFSLAVVPVTEFLLTFDLDVVTLSVEPRLLIIEDPDESLNDPEAPFTFV